MTSQRQQSLVEVETRPDRINQSDSRETTSRVRVTPGTTLERTKKTCPYMRERKGTARDAIVAPNVPHLDSI